MSSCLNSRLSVKTQDARSPARPTHAEALPRPKAFLSVRDRTELSFGSPQKLCPKMHSRRHTDCLGPGWVANCKYFLSLTPARHTKKPFPKCDVSFLYLVAQVHALPIGLNETVVREPSRKDSPSLNWMFYKKSEPNTVEEEHWCYSFVSFILGFTDSLNSSLSRLRWELLSCWCILADRCSVTSVARHQRRRPGWFLLSRHYQNSMRSSISGCHTALVIDELAHQIRVKNIYT